MSRARVKCRVFVDFDGTIATVDTTDLLLERFAAPAWRDIEDDWRVGRIGSRECLVRQIDLVRASEAEMDAFVAGIEIDGGFQQFVRLCRRLGHSVAVVSDGLDRTVEAVLEGEPASVDRMLSWMRAGPAGAIVRDVHVVEEPPSGAHSFLVK